MSDYIINTSEIKVRITIEKSATMLIADMLHINVHMLISRPYLKIFNSAVF